MKYQFPERLKNLRESAGLSQRQLAKALNSQITDSAIGLWELNKRIPTLESAMLIAEYFGVSIDYLAGLED